MAKSKDVSGKSKKRTAVSGMPAKRKKFSGVNYTHQTCGNKTSMKSRAEAARKKGKKARVVKNGSKYCLYTRG